MTTQRITNNSQSIPDPRPLAAIPGSPVNSAKTIIRSVSRASQILLAVAASANGLVAKDVAERFGLSLPTAYHLLTTLTSDGLLFKNSGKRYVLGPGAAAIAASVSRGTEAPEYFMDPLRELAATTGETAYLSAWRRGQITVLATIEGPQAVRVTGLTAGYGEDMHARASAKIMLAYASDEVRNEALRYIKFRKITPNTITDRAQYLRELNTVRTEGLAYDRQEFDPGVQCVSAPIMVNDELVACYTVSTPASRFEEEFPQILKALKQAVSDAATVAQEM